MPSSSKRYNLSLKIQLESSLNGINVEIQHKFMQT